MGASPHDEIRRSYDEVSSDYLARLGDELDHKPLDRALLTAVLEQARPGGLIADIGCGPGHVTRWLTDRGADCVGIDLSEGMIDLAQVQVPTADFRVGDLLDLPAMDHEFAAVVALYAIVHLEQEELAAAFDEVHRVLEPDGLFLVSFHTGTEIRHRDEWFGHRVNLDFRFFEPEDVIARLARCGFELRGRLTRPNYSAEVATERAYLLARPGDGDEHL